MTRGTRTGVLWTIVIVAIFLAFAALRSPDPLTDAVGAVVLVVLAGWLVVRLYRARDRMVG